MRRIFIAVKVYPEERLSSIISSFKISLAGENVKWVEPENIHLTLAFAGETSDEKIINISNLLQEKCPGFGNFEFILKGMGVFKNFREPRAIWAGIQLSDKLVRLNELVNTVMKISGINIENRVFKPHLTIGRIKMLKSQTNLKTLLEKYHDVEIQKVQVHEVILFESILKPAGPLYKPVSIISLG